MVRTVKVLTVIKPVQNAIPNKTNPVKKAFNDIKGLTMKNNNAIPNKTNPVKKAFNDIKGLTMKVKLDKIPRVFRNLQAMKPKVKTDKKLDNVVRKCKPGQK